MKLSTQEAEHFFYLLRGLQLFVNQTLLINPGIDSVDRLIELDERERLPIRNAVWEHPELIDKFLAANPMNLNADDRAIVAGWKKFVKGTFYVERMLKKYTIFILGKRVYGVLALFDSFENFFHRNQLPVAVQAVLLPFQGQIVYDGMLLSYPLLFGGGISGNLKETYLAAKQNDEIITSLGGGGKALAGPPVVEELPDYSSELQAMGDLLKKLKASRDAPPVWSPAFTLLRGALDLAEQSVAEPDDIDGLWSKLKKIESGSKRMGTVLRRAER
ncbi:MAG: hypothetical protein KJZ86_08060 [Caldilineaceae bacterium]|nr:hypothetical protein [Caldilineaceae bacterium]